MYDNMWSRLADAQASGLHVDCPRCGGSMHPDLSMNSLSRYMPVYICPSCGEDEALRTTPVELKDWWLSEHGRDVVLCKDVVITDKDIDDIMATALEGGINYWCCGAKIGEEEYLGEFASEQISRGGSLILDDIEDGKSYVLTKWLLINGFQTAYRKGYANSDEWIVDGFVECGNIDAVAADLIVQCAIFDEVIYG